MKVMIGIATYDDKIDIYTVNSLLALIKPCSCDFMIVSRMRVDKARNVIARDAIKKGMDAVLFVDDDNPFPVDTLKRFIDSGKDIVGALIPTRNAPVKKCVYKIEVEDGIPTCKNMSYTPDKLFKCDAVGSGCLFVKAEVLEKIDKRYGTIFEIMSEVYECEKEDGTKEVRRRMISEDLEFCRRAYEQGFDVHCDPEVRPFHLGTARMWQVQTDGSLKDIGV
jgi:hypothetical protein